jgi:hypothetical protein
MGLLSGDWPGKTVNSSADGVTGVIGAVSPQGFSKTTAP